MANIGQILIKIGRQWDDAAGWLGAASVAIPFVNFCEIMRSPMYPSYAASKTIREKWTALRYYYGLVDQACPDVPSPTVVYINRDRAKAIIQESIPKRIKSNYAAREHYLKTGEVVM